MLNGVIEKVRAQITIVSLLAVSLGETMGHDVEPDPLTAHAKPAKYAKGAGISALCASLGE
jgi:hypothetical protein